MSVVIKVDSHICEEAQKLLAICATDTESQKSMVCVIKLGAATARKCLIVLSGAYEISLLSHLFVGRGNECSCLCRMLCAVVLVCQSC